MGFSKELEVEVKSDVEGKEELKVEEEIIKSLKEIKEQVIWLEDEDVRVLYRDEFKAFLKGRKFNRYEKNDDNRKKLKNIKNGIIERELEKRKDEVLKPNRVTRNVIYPVCWISMNINKNWKIKNLVKWVIDELMALPDMILEIKKHPVDFAKGMARIISNPKQMIKSILESFTDAFTQWLWTPEAQYRTWRSATLIVLSFFPWWIWKWLLNIAKKSAKLVKKASMATKRMKVEIRQATSPIESKSAFTRKPRAEIIEEKVWNNARSLQKQWEKAGDKVRHWAEKKATESQNKHVEKAAKKHARWAEREIVRQEALRTFRKKMREYLSKITLKNNPLSKVREFVRNRTVKKLDGVREWILQKFYPKFYKDLKTLESKIPGLKIQIERAAKDLQKTMAKKIELNRKITDLKEMIKKAEDLEKQGKVYRNYNIEWKWTKFDLQWLKNQLWIYQSELSSLEKAMEWLNKALYSATKRLAIFDRIINTIRSYPENQMVKNINIAGQLSAEVQYAIEWEMNYEIGEARKKISESLEKINKGIDNDYKKLVKWDKTWIDTWRANIPDIDLHIPYWCDLSKVDPNLYTITVIWMASKTWSRAFNEKLALQRANNAKQRIINQYRLTPQTKFNIKIDLQVNYVDKMGDDTSIWQWVDVKVVPKPWKEREYRDALVKTSIWN